MKEERYIPRIGDIVIITRSNENWSDSMNKFVGQKFEISEVRDTKRGDVRFKDMPLDMEKWFWEYKDGHFTVYTPSLDNRKPKKLKLKLS